MMSERFIWDSSMRSLAGATRSISASAPGMTRITAFISKARTLASGLSIGKEATRFTTRLARGSPVASFRLMLPSIIRGVSA